jgi:hypothetical protein
VKLPFLENTSKWPISREPEERVVNPSYDTQIEDHLVDEIFVAMEKKHVSKFREALIALIEHLHSQEMDDATLEG